MGPQFGLAGVSDCLLLASSQDIGVSVEGGGVEADEASIAISVVDWVVVCLVEVVDTEWRSGVESSALEVFITSTIAKLIFLGIERFVISSRKPSVFPTSS